METLLIHDLTPKQLSAVLPDTSGYTIIDANRSAAFARVLPAAGWRRRGGA